MHRVSTFFYLVHNIFQVPNSAAVIQKKKLPPALRANSKNYDHDY